MKNLLLAAATASLVGCSTTTGIASRHVGTMSINAKAGKDIVFNVRDNRSEQAADKAIDAIKASAAASAAASQQGDANNAGNADAKQVLPPPPALEIDKPQPPLTLGNQ